MTKTKKAAELHERLLALQRFIKNDIYFMNHHINDLPPKTWWRCHYCGDCTTVDTCVDHILTCWKAELDKIKARPDYESILACMELQEESKT